MNAHLLMKAPDSLAVSVFTSKGVIVQLHTQICMLIIEVRLLLVQ